MNNPLRALIFALLVSLTLLGCGEEEEGPIPEFEFALEVEAKDQDDDPLPGIPVLLDGEVIGLTDANGEFTATLLEQPTVEIELAVQEIDGYHLISDNAETRQELRVTEAIGGGYRGVPVSLRTQFQSMVSQHLIWAQVECDDGLDDGDCSGLPLLLDGEEVALTDSRGYAYAVFDAIPGEEHTVRIQTPPNGDDNPKFKPENPTFTFEAPRSTTVYSIVEAFEDPDYSPAPRRRAPRRQQQPQRQPDPEPQQEEEDSSGGAIPLF